MNFPLDNPVMQFLYWLVNTPGIGGVIAMLLGGGSILAYALMLNWIKKGGDIREDLETYVYPTPALHHEENA